MTKKPKLTRQQKRIQKIHNKTVLMYGVVPTAMRDSIDEEDFIKAEESPELKAELKEKVMNIYTIVPTRDEAVEFIKNHIILKNKFHFDRWCELHNHKPTTEEARQAYLNTVIDMNNPDNQYSIIDIKYTYEDLAIILRMSAGCAPIGCSFDNEVEIEAFLAREAIRKATEKESEKNSQKEVTDSKKTDKSPVKRRRGRPKKVIAQDTPIKGDKK